MTQPTVDHDRVVDLVWARSLEKIIKGDGPPPIRESIGDDIDVFVPQIATGLLLSGNPAFARVLYSAAFGAAKRNSFFAMRRLGMPSDFFWKFDMWSDDKAQSTISKVVERIFRALLHSGRQGLLEFKNVNVPATRFRVDFADCAECHGVDAENAACYFHAGTFAGIFSAMLDRDLECAEIECSAAGAEQCSFIIGLPDDREVGVPLERNMENIAVSIDQPKRMQAGHDSGGDSGRRLVDIGYYQLLLSSAIAGNLGAFEGACFKTGVAVGQELAADLASRSGGANEHTIQSIYQDLRYLDLTIESSAIEVIVRTIGTPESVGSLADASFVPFLAGELQRLLVAAGYEVKFSRTEKRTDGLDLIFVPQV